MRLAEIAPPWLPLPPDGYGGIERVVDLLAGSLQRAGHEVTLFAASGSRSAARVVTLLPAGTAGIGDPETEAGHVLAAYTQAGEFDVIHDHTSIGPTVGALSEGSPPIVHTLHGPWSPSARGYYALLSRHVHLVAISESQRSQNDLARYAATIPNGIDLDAYPLGSGAREDFLVYIGRATPDKGPDLALELAHRAGLPLKLVVKRREPAELGYWERSIEPLLRETDEVLPEVSQDEKVELLQRGRAFVFPIRWNEPFGLVMIEAMACGMPVIATPRGAAAEIVEDGVTGFLREGLEELVTCVRDSRNIDPSACRARVERRFSGRAMVDGYERLFDSVVGDRRHRARRRPGPGRAGVAS